MFIWLLLLLFAGCRSEKSGDAVRIVIISTNDMHAQIDRFPKLAAFVKQQRAENKYVILADAGDRFSGNVYVDNALEKGEPIISLMNSLGYDVAAMGNHEFDYGQQVLRKRIEQAAFPVLCANMRSEGSQLGSLPAYRILEVAGVKLAFLSLIETGSDQIPSTNPEHLEGITFPYYREVAAEYAHLKQACDAFIGLTHLGFYSDSVLAVRHPELDVIIGGHSHTLIKTPCRINNVLISQTGSGLKYAGVTTLDFQGGKLTGKEYRVVSLDTVGEEDPETVRMVEEFCNRPEFKEELGVTSGGLKYKENVASLMTDAMCMAAGCDFAFYNSGGVRLNSVPAGSPITLETLYGMEPFANYIVTQNMKQDEMKDLILTRFNSVKDPSKRSIDLFISDGQYTIRKDREGKGYDVVFKDKNGNALSASAVYKVGFSNYVYSTYTFKNKGGGVDSGITIVDAMIGFVKSRKDVNYNKRRTFVVEQ